VKGLRSPTSIRSTAVAAAASSQDTLSGTCSRAAPRQASMVLWISASAGRSRTAAMAQSAICLRGVGIEEPLRLGSLHRTADGDAPVESRALTDGAEHVLEALRAFGVTVGQGLGDRLGAVRVQQT
jgi:hypothetical protein